MPGKISAVFAWHSEDGWELHIHGLGRTPACTIAQFLLMPHGGFAESGTGSLLIQPMQSWGLQPDVYSLHHVLRVLRQTDDEVGGLIGLHRRIWHLNWQLICSSGLILYSLPACRCCFDAYLLQPTLFFLEPCLSHSLLSP
jgi:hypothetical protein